MNRSRAFAAAALVLLAAMAPAALAQTAAEPPAAEESEPATHYFPADADGPAVLDRALADAAAQGKRAVIVFGADWCHDSRALARVLLSDGFAREFSARYAVTFIDVGKPQTGEGRNLDLVKRLGIARLRSTPAMFVVAPGGRPVNSARDAAGWRNAASRGDAAILGWFRTLSPRG